MMVRTTVLLSMSAACCGAKFKHMNTDVKYTVGNPAPGSEGRAMDFHGEGFFTVDTPKFKSQYSQVVWHSLGPTPLPKEIVQKYDGKVMSVTGWEVDVLRDVNGTATPVPCYESYNHHYGGALQGKGADLEIVYESDDQPMIGHGGPRMVFTSNDQASGNYPTHQSFAEHNGNEARQTLHWMPKGYGTPVESPTAFVFTPMQINTRNPDGSGRRCGLPGTNCPMPHQQNAWKGAAWSGILECPCNYGGNTRMIKTFDHRMEATECTYNSTVTIESECFAVAAADKSLNGKITKNATVDDASKPYGCSVSTDGSVVTYNTATAKTSCAGAGQCICRAATGWINGKRFEPDCIGEPRSELLSTHNPTCDINVYDGGLQCCGGTDIVDGKHTNTRFLLDADAEIPPLVDEVWFRWRFYYEDYMPSLQDTYHVEWQFGNIEYSVPKAAAGTPPEEAVHTLTTHFQVKDLHSQSAQCSGSKSCSDWDLTGGLPQKPIKLIMLGFHCHSPSCLGGKLWNADTGELLCHVKPVLGNSTTVKFEEDYLWLPPCQWGSADDGLLPPPVLHPDTNFTSVKWTNNTVAHSGVMAIWQGRAAYAQPEDLK